MGMFGHNGWLGGKHSLGGKFSSGFGDFLNDITGQSSSAKQQFKQQMALQHDAQDFSKWQMANAHQMEVQDLQNAGLNPILSANAGASAGVTEGGTTGGTPSADPMAMAGAIISMMNSTKQTNATVNNLEKQGKLYNAETTKALKEAGLTQKQIDYYMKHGVFPGATITKSGGTSVGWGAASGNRSQTVPVGLNNSTNSSKAFANMSKEKWKKYSKAQKAMFPKELRDLYNETYKD